MNDDIANQFVNNFKLEIKDYTSIRTLILNDPDILTNLKDYLVNIEIKCNLSNPIKLFCYVVELFDDTFIELLCSVSLENKKNVVENLLTFMCMGDQCVDTFDSFLQNNPYDTVTNNFAQYVTISLKKMYDTFKHILASFEPGEEDFVDSYTLQANNLFGIDEDFVDYYE
jgi:hypothetical protein